VTPGSGAVVNMGQFTFIAACKNPTAGCHGTAVYTGASTGGKSGKTSAWPAKATILGKGSFAIPSGKKGKIVVKLVKAAQATLRKRHKLRGTVTITLQLGGGKATKLSHAYTLTLVKKR
jgi:hypothetical protein